MPYFRPGVYISQKYQSTGVSRGDFMLPCVAGVGLANKRMWADPIIRGGILETVTPDTGGEFTLTHDSNEYYAHSILYRDGTDLGHNSFEFVDAQTVQIKTPFFNENSTYQFRYVATDVDTDALLETMEQLIFVAATDDGSRQFRKDTDFQIAGNSIDWSILTEATLTGANSQNFNLTSLNKIKIAVDGQSPITVTITGNNQAAVTAAEVVADINSAASSAWGADYATIASVSTTKVKITSVLKGESGRINFYAPTTADATNLIFGFDAPHAVIGGGTSPALGATYYVRYDYARPADDYNTVKTYLSYNDAFNDLGPMRLDNDVLIGLEVLFQNGATRASVVQVQDEDGDGLYTDTDWITALDALKTFTAVTDVVLLTGDTDVMAYLIRVIEDESALAKGHWMGGWFGVANNVEIGNMDTQGTACYIAANLLQVSGESQGRGRFILTYPPNVKREILDSDTKVVYSPELASYFAACAILGLQASFNPISESLLRKQIVGFDQATFVLTQAEAAQLAANGIIALVNKGGRIIVFDPVTTDAGGDPVFVEPNVRFQKDYLAYRIRNRLDEYIVGVVPDSLDDFLFEIKHHIADEIEAAVEDKTIAPYIADATGLSRRIDYTTDIKVFQSQANRTEYRFVYYFVPRYVAKRLFGEYVVDRALL
jgi:hypothetical protein